MEKLGLAVIGTGSVAREIYEHLYYRSRYAGDLMVPDFGVVPRYFSGTLSSSPESFQVYNPSGYSFIWNVSEQANDTPDAGDTTTKGSYSAVTSHAATVTLPDQTTSTNPSNGVDVTTSTYAGGVFTHPGISGANMNVATFVDESTPPRNGMVLMAGTQITLPPEIDSTIIGTGSAWDVQLQAAWLSDPWMELVIGKIGPFGPIGLSDLEIVIIVDSSSTAVDLIP